MQPLHCWQAFFNINLQINSTHIVAERHSPKDNASFKGISGTPATSTMEFLVTLISGCKSLANVTKSSISDVAGVPGSPFSDVC